jgi:hypothetical protein
MPRTQQFAHQGRPTDLDLDLERHANAWNTPPEDRDAILRTAEILGCDVAAQRIRDTARRRARVQPAPPPAPRPGPAPRLTPPRPPILVALNGADAPASAVTPDADWWHDVQRVASRHDATQLSPAARVLLDALGQAAQASLT